MSADEALSDINAALGQSAAQSNAAVAAPPQSGADAALADFAKSPEQLRAELGQTSQPSGGTWPALQNAGQFAFTAAARGLGGLADYIPDPLAPIRRMISPRIENIEQSMRPHPGQAAADAAFNVTGVPEYKPGGAIDRILLSAATGGVGGGPFGPSAAALGALGGLLGQTTSEAASTNGLSPDWSDRLATAASLSPGIFAPLVRGAANTVVGKARETLGPELSRSYREGLVGEQLRSGASDLGGLKSSLMIDQPGPLNQSLIPAVPDAATGEMRTSLPTLFQLTGDMGIGQMERGARTPDATPFLDRAAEQNKARVGQIESLAPENASPSAVRDLLKSHLDALDAEGEANIARAQKNAQQAFDQTGGRLSPEDYGALMRDQLEAAKASAKQNASNLWKAIDPSENMTIDATPTRQAAEDILGKMSNTAKPPEGEEKAVFDLAQAAGPADSFTAFSDLRSRLLAAIRQERPNGETQALRRMQQLRSAMDETISGAADDASQSDAGLVRRLNENLNELTGAATQSRTATGGINGDSSSAFSSGAASMAPGMVGSAGGRAGGPGNAAGRAGVSGASPEGGVEAPANFDAAAAERYRAAANAWREQKQTFNNPTVGPVLQELGSGDYRMFDSRVPQRFLSSPEGVQAFLSAGGDAATLRDALAADLRGTAPDGTISPSRFLTWQRQRAAALNAFPELQQSLDTVVKAQEAVDAVSAASRQRSLDFQTSAARHFLNAEPDKAVQSALASKNPVADFRELSRMVSSNPDAKAGLERAFAEYIARNYIGNTEAGTSGVGTVKSDAFQSFMRQHGSALAQVFSPELVQGMRNVAADLQRSNRSIVGSKIPGQSNTPQDLALQSGKLSILRKYLMSAEGSTQSGGAAGLLLGALHGTPVEGAILGSSLGMAKAVISRMKAAGIEKTSQLMTEALLNPELGRTLLMKDNPASRPFIARKLRATFGRIVGASASRDAAETQQ